MKAETNKIIANAVAGDMLAEREVDEYLKKMEEQ
jgi:hypothetical protein